MKEKVLFICVHNSARSQMAEEYLRKLASDRFEVESAGLEPGTINPLVVEVLKEEGIDITGKKTNSVFEFYKEGRRYHYVITVCSKEASERCLPVCFRVHAPLPAACPSQAVRQDPMLWIPEQPEQKGASRPLPGVARGTRRNGGYPRRTIPC